MSNVQAPSGTTECLVQWFSALGLENGIHIKISSSQFHKNRYSQAGHRGVNYHMLDHRCPTGRIFCYNYWICLFKSGVSRTLSWLGIIFLVPLGLPTVGLSSLTWTIYFPGKNHGSGKTNLTRKIYKLGSDRQDLLHHSLPSFCLENM